MAVHYFFQVLPVFCIHFHRCVSSSFFQAVTFCDRVLSLFGPPSTPLEMQEPDRSPNSPYLHTSHENPPHKSEGKSNDLFRFFPPFLRNHLESGDF